MTMYCKVLIRAPFFLPAIAFAGQSLVVNGSSNISVTDPVISATQSWRVEFQIHNWTIPPAGVYSAMLFDLLGTGSLARLYPDGTLDLETVDQVTQQQPCFVSTAGLTNALVRVQKNASAMLFSCEIWNYDGTGYSSQILNIAKLEPRPYTGGTVGPGASAALGFLRVATTLMPLGAKPPTTADGGNWTELKFDGNLKDSSGNNHNASGSGATYMGTPNQVAVANPKTSGAPSWSNWVSLRAGYAAQLDGSSSYSLADASSAVTCLWQQVDGPSNVIWTNAAALMPILNGLIFGTYDFSLQVTDAAGNTASAPLQIGAVATDDNGVVINADPNVDRIFGPMIAFGRNPWGYADERAMTATQLRMAAYNAAGLNPPSWTTAGPGAVSYTFNGAGPAGAPATTLSSAIGSADTAISVADASPLDLSSLPTRILLGPIPREEVRICGASATTGPATLTVCYDGRGQSSPADSYRAAAQPWPAGTAAGQMKVDGSGTRFLTSICPAGAGPNGAAVYAAGFVRMTPGATLVAGSGTNWSTANNVVPSYLVRVSATHGGAPFVFSAYIASVADLAHLTLARPYPADADAGSFRYSIIQADYIEITLHYARATDGSDAQTYFQTSGCESDTDVYLYQGHDIPSLDGSLQSGKQYSYMDGYGYASAYGANFYGEDLAHRALYYRSGWTPALQAARVMGDNYVNSPQVDGGDIGGIPLLIGGGVIGGFAAAVLDTTDPNRPSWDSLRGLATSGSIGSSACNAWDTRDSGYLEAWLTLAAEFDPDPVQQANWQSQVEQVLSRDQLCKGANNSWANGFLWNNASAPVNLTNGSAAATGNNLPSSMCYGIASGTVTVVNGSATAMGSGFVAGNKIVITGTMNGLPYTGFFQFSINSNGSITLAALWPGDSGGASFVIENNDYLTTIGTSNNDPQLIKNWACTWNSPSQITLNRPWDGPTEGGAYLYSYTLAGYGQQAYMLGIKITQMQFASQIGNPGFSASYAALATDAATWVHDVGYDSATQGMNYGRMFQACEPETVPTPNTTFSARTPGCNYGLDPGSTQAARVLTAEASQALRVYYQANPTAAAKTWGDTAYGSIWGYPPYTTGGVYSDSNYVRNENSNASLGAYKWTGFFFGMGMAHQWPAVRLGGVAAPAFRKVALEVKQGIAVKTQISVTAPSGKVTFFPCGADSHCEVEVDDRQGSHWYATHYLSADGEVLFQSAPALIDRRPDPSERTLGPDHPISSDMLSQPHAPNP
jgi:hypothetical protein